MPYDFRKYLQDEPLSTEAGRITAAAKAAVAEIPEDKRATVGVIVGLMSLTDKHLPNEKLYDEIVTLLKYSHLDMLCKVYGTMFDDFAHEDVTVEMVRTMLAKNILVAADDLEKIRKHLAYHFRDDLTERTLQRRLILEYIASEEAQCRANPS